MELPLYETAYDLCMSEKEPTTQLNVMIRDRLHRKVKIRAVTTGVTIKQLVLQLIEKEFGDNAE